MYKIKLIIITILLCFTFKNSKAQESPDKFQSLFDSCEAALENLKDTGEGAGVDALASYHSGYCIGFIQASVVNSFFNAREKGTESSCIHMGYSWEQWIRIIVNYGKNHPQILNADKALMLNNLIKIESKCLPLE